MRVLLSQNDVRQGVERMAKFVEDRFGDSPITIVGVMTGSVMLLADLIRLLKMPMRVGVVQASSYRGETTRSELVVNSDLTPDVAGREVLLLDDIFDTGHTLMAIVEHLRRKGARSICTAVLLRKAERKEAPIEPDFAAFDIPNEFVIGYGLDYRDEHRNLPFIGVLEENDLGSGE
ncbi:MAG: hypoxanthine phosphoribosyltransferase [Planctomycetes bacterium]|nr:hypoxanthine phosphoribosyltransferase [Planctomycetota bacterium]